MKLLTKTIDQVVTDNEGIGHGCRKERKSAGVSLRGMAIRMGISAPYLSDLERGNRNWTEAILETFNRCLKKGKQ